MVFVRLKARRAELVREIFARVSDDAFAPPGGTGSSGAQDVEYVAGLRAAVAAAVEYALGGIERGEVGSGPIPAVALEQARRAARAGVSLDTVLRRYVVGHTLLEQVVMEEAECVGEDWGPPAQSEALREAMRTQALVLDRLLREITAEYEDERTRMGSSPERRRCELVRALLTGELSPGSTGGLGSTASRGGEGIASLDLGRELGYELEAEHVGVVAWGAGAREALREVAGGLDRRLLCVECGEDAVWAWFGGRRRLEMLALERELAGLSGSVVFAVGEPARGLGGWRLTHQQAQAALVVALRRRGPPAAATVTRYGDVALLASALKDELLGRALVEVYVAPLEDAQGRGRVLRRTLRAYLAAECSASSAAVVLHVARSTVEKRLSTIEDKLARTLHPCPAELEVALDLYDLGGFAPWDGDGDLEPVAPM